MANNNVVSADLNGGWSCVTAPLWQWDYGQVLEITGIDDLPSSFVAHCANRWDGSSQTVLGSNGRLSIPNDLLTSGEPVYVWIILTADGTDGETKYKITIPVNRRAAPTDYPTTAQQSAITQAINALNTAAANAAAEVAAELVDPTLAVSGKAADAAKTGEELGNLKSDVDTLNEGGLVLKDDVITEDIINWLDEHPEATTTVQDWSLTYRKLVKGTLGYAIPEMYGAVGDGETDDTDAINAALANNNLVILLDKTYKTTKPIYVPSYTSLIGTDRIKSKIYNVGTGYNKNAVICGHVGGDSGTDGIRYAPEISYVKQTSHSFQSGHLFKVNEIVHFKVAASNNSTSQMVSTSTYITSKNGDIYTTMDDIPDNATLHSYEDTKSQDSISALTSYTCFGSRVENFTIEHLPTGSGMYCLFMCGAEQIAKDIITIGNSGLASNLCVHNTWENIECFSYGDNLDCAEYVYFTKYKNIKVTKINPTAQTLHTQFAFGRGHHISVDEFVSNIENPIALEYTQDFEMSNSDFWCESMTGSGNENIVFKKCKIHSTNNINVYTHTFKDCYIEKPAVSANITEFFLDNVVSDYENIQSAAKNYVHKIGWEKQIGLIIGAFSSVTVGMYDNAIDVTVQGSNLSLTNGVASVTGTSKIQLIVTGSGTVRLSRDGGAIYGPGWSNTGEFTFSGSISAIEKKSAVLSSNI